MTSLMTKTTILGTLTALTFGTGLALAVPSSAEAGPRWRHHHRHHYAWGAAGIGAGLALGALAASAYARPVYTSECYTVRRRVVDDWGRVHIRRVHVCD